MVGTLSQSEGGVCGGVHGGVRGGVCAGVCGGVHGGVYGGCAEGCVQGCTEGCTEGCMEGCTDYYQLFCHETKISSLELNINGITIVCSGGSKGGGPTARNFLNFMQFF